MAPKCKSPAQMFKAALKYPAAGHLMNASNTILTERPDTVPAPMYRISNRAINTGRDRNAVHHLPLAGIEKEESQWWRAFKEGNERAFTCIYNRYMVSLYRYGRTMTPDKQLIEDSIHDFFVDLWKNRNSIAQANSVKHYLFKGLRRKIIKNLIIKRKLPDHAHVAEDYDFEMTSSREFELIANQVSVEQRKRLSNAIGKLTRRQKEAITLKFYVGLTYQQVAIMLSISSKSTYTLIYRALDVLKEQITV